MAAENKDAQAHRLWDLPRSRVRASAVWAAGCVPTVRAGTFYWAPNCTVKEEIPCGPNDLTANHQTQPPLLLSCQHIFAFLYSWGSFSEALAADPSEGRARGILFHLLTLLVILLREWQGSVAFSFNLRTQLYCCSTNHRAGRDFRSHLIPIAACRMAYSWPYPEIWVRIMCSKTKAPFNQVILGIGWLRDFSALCSLPRGSGREKKILWLAPT